MYIAFCDEFGHSGPFIARSHNLYSQSPVFGLAGYLLPYREVREFSTYFFQLKRRLFQFELQMNGKHPAVWEKKGASFINTRVVKRYSNIREGISRFLNRLDAVGGTLIWYGREKFQSPELSNAQGLYTTVLSKMIIACDRYCHARGEKFMMIMDQHSDRLRLLESATKTMYSTKGGARCLLEPPMQVESHLYQSIQAADWLATLIGRIQAYETRPVEFSDWEWSVQLYGQKVARLSSHSRLWRPTQVQRNAAGV